MKLQEFEKRYQNANQKYQTYLSKSNQLSIIRFVLFIIAIVILLIGYFQNIHILYLGTLLCLALFCFVVSWHSKIKQKVLYYQSLQQVYREHIQRINNQWDQFQEDGHEFINDDLSMDLDLFGHHSLFQMMNVTFTYQGKKLLADNLTKHQLSYETILKRQEALKEWQNHEDLFIQIQTYGKMLKTKDEKIIHQFIKSLTSYHYHHIPLPIFILPIIVFISIFCLCFSIGLPYTYIICEISVVLQIIITFAFFKQHHQLFDPVKKLHDSLKNYYQLFKMIQNETFQSPLLKEIQEKIGKNQHALQGIEALSRISQGISYRQNILLLILFNGLGLYDFILRNAYLRWIDEYGIEMKQWFEALSQIELLMSLYVLKIDDFDVTQPTLVDKMELSFQQLKHPLISADCAVGNSFTLEKNVCVITGSNMSGKTTFMRTIALNLLLAYIGGYIFGEKMRCSCMTILTSMRVKDNVGEGISTFYGELLRIKKMIEYSQKKIPMICFIDEIFKGTNSLDRIAGAKATIQKLSLPYCILFITTHDFELCECQDIDIANYHFDEYYKDSKIYFDYLIRKGRSQSTNGQFLLKQLGIIE